MRRESLFYCFAANVCLFICAAILVFVTPIVISAQENILYDDLFSVSFPDEKHGWACGRWGAVLHTADGGATWKKQRTCTDYTLSSISFVDSNNGWAVGDEGTIIHTTDGGATWARQESPVPYFLMDVLFLTPQRGWIVTERTHILYTEDGGRTWTVQFADEDFILKAISFADARYGWAVGEYGYICHTADGGKTWKQQAGYFDISDVDGSILGGTFLFDVEAVDAQTAWAVGIDSHITTTSDGGTTWNVIDVGIDKTHLFCLEVPKEGTVVIGGEGVALASGDNGNSWERCMCNPPISYTYVYDVTKREDAGYIAVGGEGVVYRGASTSWERVSY